MEVFKALYDLDVIAEEFIPFAGQGEEYFLGGVARKYGADFDAGIAKSKFFEIYLEKYAKPGSRIAYPGMPLWEAEVLDQALFEKDLYQPLLCVKSVFCKCY